MADASTRIINIMKRTNIDTKSNLVSLTVKSKDPLQLSMGDKLILSEEFVMFDSYIDTSKIEVGDIFRAISLNSDQIYYVTEIISSDKQLDKYLQRIERIEDYLDI